MSLDQIVGQMRQQIGQLYGEARKQGELLDQLRGGQERHKQAIERYEGDLKNVYSAMQRVSGSSSGSGGGERGWTLDERIRYIESIPGRRIPFDMVCTIPIPANSTTEVQQTRTVSQDGPFVAVARSAIFLSAYQFLVSPGEGLAPATFQGRSYGRYRPIHSAWDLNDGQAGYQPVVGVAAPGAGAPIYASPSNHSSFRSMQFDGYIEFLNQGSGYFRQSDPVPTSAYTNSINEPFQLPAMDFFERGEVLQWKVRPNHVNNPPAGNVTGILGDFPFLDSQYDVHEGIADTGEDDVDTDPVTRLPNGFLIIIFHGIKIVQPPGPVKLT